MASSLSKTNSVTLYLKKDQSEEIAVHSPMDQHDIDSIRFIYKQYVRRKPGVILNNPDKIGHRFQVVLFLSAIFKTKTVLDKPILIVSEQNKEHEWMDYFKMQTQCSNAVVVAAPNAFVSKSVFINTMEGLHGFSRRDWSIIVVDNDIILQEKVLLTKFKADFKIWIPSFDVKEFSNIKEFTTIYKWIATKGAIDILNECCPKSSDPITVISKAIWFETFLEDLVFKNYNIPSKVYASINMKRSAAGTKDITGTKIKRTKRPVAEIKYDVIVGNDEDPGVSAVKNANSDTLVNNNRNCTSTDNKLNNNNTTLNAEREKKESASTRNEKHNKQSDDVESFIRNKEPIQFDFVGDFNIDCNSDSDNEVTKAASSKKFTLLSDSDNDSAYDLDTQELPENNIDVAREADSSSSKNSEQSKNASSTDLPCNENAISNRSIIEGNGSETCMKEKTPSKFNNMESKEPYEDIKAKDILSKPNEISNINANNISTEQIETIADEADEIAKPKLGSPIKKNNELDIDSKITEHEELIFKKFKGTFLDSIF